MSQSTFIFGVALSFFVFVVIRSFFLYMATKKKRWITVMLCAQFFSAALLIMGWPSQSSNEADSIVEIFGQSQPKQIMVCDQRHQN